MSRRAWRTSAATLVLLLGVGLGAAAPAAADSEDLRIPGGPSAADDPTAVSLDATLHVPSQLPAPAIVLAHGFGGSKDSVAEEAAFLTEQGFVVLAYSARGFGASTGQISMNSPEFEVADASPGHRLPGPTARGAGRCPRRPARRRRRRLLRRCPGTPRGGLRRPRRCRGGRHHLERPPGLAVRPVRARDRVRRSLPRRHRRVQATVDRAVLQRRTHVSRRRGDDLRPLHAAVVRRLHRGRNPGNRVRRGRRAHAPLVARQHRRPHRRADPARRRTGGLAVPARAGERHRRADRAGAPRHPAQGGLARGGPRRRRRTRPSGCASSRRHGSPRTLRTGPTSRPRSRCRSSRARR